MQRCVNPLAHNGREFILLEACPVSPKTSDCSPPTSPLLSLPLLGFAVWPARPRGLSGRRAGQALSNYSPRTPCCLLLVFDTQLSSGVYLDRRSTDTTELFKG